MKSEKQIVYLQGKYDSRRWNAKKINVSQNLKKVVLRVLTPPPPNIIGLHFLDIEHWTQSLKRCGLDSIDITIAVNTGIRVREQIPIFTIKARLLDLSDFCQCPNMQISTSADIADTNIEKCNLTLAMSPTCPQHKPSAYLFIFYYKSFANGQRIKANLYVDLAFFGQFLECSFYFLHAARWVQTRDRKRCIWAHRASYTGGLKNVPTCQHFRYRYWYRPCPTVHIIWCRG